MYVSHIQMAKTNRLKLDFSLSTDKERQEFLTQYLESDMFKQRPPTPDELETMADYLLWGKNEEGLNGKQQGLDLRSKHGTWDDSPVDSLEELMESPTFNEASLSPIGAVRYTSKKEVFSREEALEQAPEYLKPQFITLFREIDKLDYQIEWYELEHGRRTKEIRSELTKQFTEEELCTLREATTHWNQYKYLKQRHWLVELRREQYTLRDSYRQTIFSQGSDDYVEPVSVSFDSGIEVLPLGLKRKDPMSALIFKQWSALNPFNTPQSCMKDISDLYWKKQNYKPGTMQQYFDFRELEHVYQLLNWQLELEDAQIARTDIFEETGLGELLDTLQFYVEQADLTDIQREILDMKLHKKRNTDIAWDINHKYGKTYTSNYISTIFRQRIIPKINEAAQYHEKVISNIFFEEEFKECSSCGEIKLRDADNFTRKSRSTDGFSSRCKKCEKKARQGG